MKAFIYMNHWIRDPANAKSKTPEPVITVQVGSNRTYCNEVEIYGYARVCTGKLPTPGHDVTAWVECRDSDLRIKR